MEAIRSEIHHQGPVTFARYMELALYHPAFGFYRTRDRFGAKGDFYTAEQLQPVFGELIARYVEKLTKGWSAALFNGVLELGAGKAEMASALSQWGYRAFDWGSPPFPEKWSGLIFANEFFDSLPFHLLKRAEKGWEELLIAMADHRLNFVSGELSSAMLASYASEFGADIPIGGTLEVCLALEDWCARIGTLLRDGKLLVIDYGYEIRELLRFPTGTLLTFNQHRTGIDPLVNPGCSDITAHVNFTWLRKMAAKAGLRCTNSSTLSNWVLSIWGEQDLQQRWATADQRWKLQWKNLVFGLGEAFKVFEFEH